MISSGIAHSHNHHRLDESSSPALKTLEVNLESPVAVLEYTENISAKAQEIENLRKALHNSTDKLLWEVLDKHRGLSHSKVRQNPFLQKLTLGGFCQTAFMRYLVNLLHIHTALEKAQELIINIEHLKPFIYPELFRSESIKRDLPIWESVSAAESIPWPVSKITHEFAEHITRTAKEDPERIIAIMYAFYGTIMSGGQTNKKVVQTSLDCFREWMDDIPAGSGVGLYEIVKDKKVLSDEEIAKFKMEWHQSLCLVQAALPAETSLDNFHTKLKEELTNTFDTFLKIIETNVQEGHC
jgi:hypothetical protein